MLEKSLGGNEFREEVQRLLQNAILNWCAALGDTDSSDVEEVEFVTGIINLYVRIYSKDVQHSTGEQ